MGYATFFSKKSQKVKKVFDKGQKVRYTVLKIKRQKVKLRSLAYYLVGTTQKRGSYERFSR